MKLLYMNAVLDTGQYVKTQRHCYSLCYCSCYALSFVFHIIHWISLRAQCTFLQFCEVGLSVLFIILNINEINQLFSSVTKKLYFIHNIWHSETFCSIQQYIQECIIGTRLSLGSFTQNNLICNVDMYLICRNAPLAHSCIFKSIWIHIGSSPYFFKLVLNVITWVPEIFCAWISAISVSISVPLSSASNTL